MLKNIFSALVAATLLAACNVNDSSNPGTPAAPSPSTTAAKPANATKPALSEEILRQITVKDENDQPVNACVEAYKYLTLSNIRALKNPLATQSPDQRAVEASNEQTKTIGDNLVKTGLITEEQRSHIDKSSKETASKAEDKFQTDSTGKKIPSLEYFEDMKKEQQAFARYVKICDPVLNKLKGESLAADPATASPANPLKLAEGIEYHYYADGSCKENCLTADQARQACALVKSPARGLVNLLSVTYLSGKRQAMLDGGSVTGFSTEWNGKQCMVSLTLSGVYQGTSARETFYGPGSGFIFSKGMMLVTYMSEL